MSQQHELQKQFANYLRGIEHDSMFDRFKSPNFGTRDVLAVHRNNFRLTLTDALAALFPAIKALIGERCFDAHAGRFIEASPPGNPILSTYGKKFPDYLERQLSLNNLAWLGDVARLEWAVNEALHSADAQPLTQYELVQLASENDKGLDFDLHPSLRLASSPYPLLKIWRYSRYPDTYCIKPDLLEGPQHLLILRPKRQVFVIPVDPGTHTFLDACKKSSGFSESLAAARQTFPDFALEDVLPTLVAQGVFISITTTLKEQAND